MLPGHEQVAAPPREAPKRPELKGPFGGRAFRLGRVAGIDVGLDRSWIFVFLLITFSLARGFASGEAPLGPVAAWGGALLASLLFFSSILLHEFGHSLTSNALGLPVRSITLFIFGGLARLSGEPERPRDEFLIAAAGPAVSVGLGLLFLAVGSLASLAGAPPVFAVIFGWLGSVNLILAVFNLVPGFPLDGGRILRAVVWQVTGSFERATAVASQAGAVFAFFLIGTGVFLVLAAGALFNGLWLVFIGWFLLSAARGSATQVVLERQLGAVRLEAAMAPPEPRESAGATVAQAVEDQILGQGSRFFFVGERGAPLGFVTLPDIKRVPEAERAATPVRAIMKIPPALRTLPHDVSLWKALRALDEQGATELPVERHGELVGVLTRARITGIARNLRELG